jgi:hypothetical protein
MIEVKGFEPPQLPVSAKGFRDALDLAYQRTRNVADILVKDGEIHRSIVRISVAAPVEAETLPRLPTGEPMYNRVVIANLEATTTDFAEGSAPK